MFLFLYALFKVVTVSSWLGKRKELDKIKIIFKSTRSIMAKILNVAHLKWQPIWIIAQKTFTF